MSRVEGNIFFFQNFFLEKVIIDAINVIKTNKKNLKNKWRGNDLLVVGLGGGGGWNRQKLRDIHKEHVMLLLLLFN